MQWSENARRDAKLLGYVLGESATPNRKDRQKTEVPKRMLAPKTFICQTRCFSVFSWYLFVASRFFVGSDELVLCVFLWLLSGKLTPLWKINILDGTTLYKWPCSITILNDQRVYPIHDPFNHHFPMVFLWFSFKTRWFGIEKVVLLGGRSWQLEAHGEIGES